MPLSLDVYMNNNVMTYYRITDKITQENKYKKTKQNHCDPFYFNLEVKYFFYFHITCIRNNSIQINFINVLSWLLICSEKT